MLRVYCGAWKVHVLLPCVEEREMGRGGEGRTKPWSSKLRFEEIRGTADLEQHTLRAYVYTAKRKEEQKAS